MKKILTKNLIINAKTAECILNDLRPDAPIEELKERYDKNQTETWTVDFGNGMAMDIKLCCSDFDGESTDHPLWTEAVLFRNGSEIACMEPEDEFFGLWEIIAWGPDDEEGTVYQVNVLASPEVGELLERKREGMSFSSLSGLTGIEEAELRAIDSGRNTKPSKAVLRALAAAFRDHVEEWYVASGYLRSAVISPDENPSESTGNIPDLNSLKTKGELLRFLDENGANEPALLEFLSRYDDPADRSAYWLYPICDGKNIGLYLVPVKEGVLSLPYNRVDENEYEIFDTDRAAILSAEELQGLLDIWNEYSLDTGEALAAMVATVNASAGKTVSDFAKPGTTTLKFQGSGDDTFGEYGVTGEDIDNCNSLKPIQCLIEAGKEKLVVVGQYSASNPGGGCWGIGISMADEETPIPNWPMRFANGDCPYSPTLEIDVPENSKCTWFNNGKMIKEVTV